MEAMFALFGQSFLKVSGYLLNNSRFLKNRVGDPRLKRLSDGSGSQIAVTYILAGHKCRCRAKSAIDSKADVDGAEDDVC